MASIDWSLVLGDWSLVIYSEFCILNFPMPSHVIGIDLGTTNSVLAYASLGADKPEVQLLPIPQLVAPGVIESRTTLPSFLYLAPEHELGGSPKSKVQSPKSNQDLGPWTLDVGHPFAVGEFARRQAAENPQRTVAGAKSWLAYSKVDRHQPILDPATLRSGTCRSGDQVMHSPNNQKGADDHQHDEHNDA